MIRGRHPVLVGDRRARALALYQSGMTVRAVAAEVGAAYGTLQRALHDAGLMRPHGHGGGATKGNRTGRRGGEPCAKGHPGTETYDYTTPQGRTRQRCRVCTRGVDARRASRTTAGAVR